MMDIRDLKELFREGGKKKRDRREENEVIFF